MSIPLQSIVPSYLYTQYADDSDLQAFIDAYNNKTQEYLNTFNYLNLPVYTSNSISGSLLDWVSQGIYGYSRPYFSIGANFSVGPLDTYGPNFKVPLDTQVTTTATVITVTDDILKRLLTWHFYKGDGKIFNIRWLKRRIMRFMLGTNGTSPLIDQTYQISVSFGSGNTINITCPAYPAATALQAAIQNGAAELPFQFSYNFVISGTSV